MSTSDVAIIGAGLAGATAASVLARQGVRVTLIDRWPIYPAAFKAEKFEPDQIDLLRKFDLLEPLRPMAGHIRHILGAEDGRVLTNQMREQLGIFYQDMVNGVRATLPASVDFKIGRVQDIVTDVGLQRVILVGGEECGARLLVLACGTGGDLHAKLGLRKRMIQKDQSLAFGFTIARSDGRPFPFDAVTYYPEGCDGRFAYLTLFLVGQVMRANLFSFWSTNDECTRTFVREPRRALLRLLPKLTRVIGEFDVITKVETSRIDLYQTEDYLQPGLVLLADAFQSVCPTTGTGLSRVLTDVDVLGSCVPEWLSTPGMGVDKIAGFYGNARKMETDAHSLAGARYNRQIAIDAAWRWRAQRLRRRWEKQLAGWRDYFRLTRNATA